MPVQPMFPPVHHVPIYIAAYRSAFLELTGQKADGYLARPCRSLPGFRTIIGRIRRRVGRRWPPRGRGRVLGLPADADRRVAPGRAEPRQARAVCDLYDERALGCLAAPGGLRARAARPDYGRLAGRGLPPRRLADPRRAARRVYALRHARRGGRGRLALPRGRMDVPALQPVVQDEAQIEQILGAAAIYGAGQRDAVFVPQAAATVTPAKPLADDRELGWGERLRRHASAWAEITRPFSFTASLTPVVVGGALALLHGSFDTLLFVYAALAAVLLHLGTNVLNEIYDVRKGIDTITRRAREPGAAQGPHRRARGVCACGRLVRADAGLCGAAGARRAAGRSCCWARWA